MFTTNPFAELSTFLSAAVMQTYIVVMIILVALGTIYDVLHKKSAEYFRQNMRKSKAAGTTLGGGEMVSIAIKTAVVDVAASGEFCNQKRRIAHLLTMYGFILFAVSTAIMVLRYRDGGSFARRPSCRSSGGSGLQWSASAATGSGFSFAPTLRPKVTRRFASCARTCSSFRCSAVRRSH